jgi:hypothetical protein
MEIGWQEFVKFYQQSHRIDESFESHSGFSVLERGCIGGDPTGSEDPY